MKALNLAGATVNQTPFDFTGNTQRILDVIKEGQTKGLDLICFPELTITGYGCEDMFLADWLQKEALIQLDIIAAASKNITVSVGLPVKFEGKLYNTSCLIENTKILGFYAKQHLANEGIHYEPRWFSEWPKGKTAKLEHINKISLGDITFEIQGNSVGFEICEDAWRESRPANTYDKVDIILNPSASHFSFGKWQTRKQLTLDSSKTYNCTYIYANLLGNESGRVIFDGDVYIAKDGKIIAQNKRLSFGDSKLVSVGDTADSFVSKEEEFTQAESLGLFDYWRKSKSNGFVISLSGGADSSTCAVLVSEMWKRLHNELSAKEIQSKLSFLKQMPESLKEVLTCVYQGTTNSSFETYQSAQGLAEKLDAAFHHWNIDDEVHSYSEKIESALNIKLNWVEHDIAMQNIQARTRAPIIWMVANIKNALLISTSNRSEASVGYATMDGDTAGSISPIAGVGKDFIKTWLVWAEQTLDYSSLKHVNQLEPSAELRPQDQQQEDEKDLMPYDVLNAIEKLFCYEKQTPSTIGDVINTQFNITDGPTHVAKFIRLWQRNQWKRERYAPAFHLDDYNVDSRTWMRFPILSGAL